ncbi:hypothetical protein [Planobispora rosea]|uniref:hypothetical protein n=1 Tax=Planobispora rosea TaxID=35762 RepID=UPI001670682A|nr:hypothetical protein [Planobispora rosea]
MPLLAGRWRVRLSPDGGHTFPDGRHTRPLAPLRPQLPSRPATISVYDDTGHGRLIVTDHDVKRALPPGITPDIASPQQRAQAIARITAEADAVVALITRCGGRAIVDVSPSGGRHVYIRWARALPWRELRRITRALARRFPTIDTAPMSGPAGQIRPPGAPHRIIDGQLTGYLRLTTPVEEAEQILRRPCGGKVWNALCQELTAELASLDGAGLGHPLGGAAELAEAGRTCPACGTVVEAPLDRQGHPWLPRPGGARPLPERLARLARSGDWSAAGYPSASEARLAVLNSAAAAGLRLAEIVTGMRSGPYSGLSHLLDSRATRSRSAREQSRRLRWDWRKAVTGIASHRHARSCNTSKNPHSTAPRSLPGLSSSLPAGPTGSVSGSGDMQCAQLYKVDLPKEVGFTPGPKPLLSRAQLDDANLWRVATVAPEIADERIVSWRQEILRWRTCLWLAERDGERVAGWGRAAASIRLLLRAIAVAARMDGSIQPAFGCRSLSEMTGLDYTVVARHLKRLRNEPDPLIELEQAGRGRLADCYRLRVPAAYRAQAAWLRPRAGYIDALHPALHMLGPVAALAYEALNATPTGSSELARTALISRSATSEALRVLAAYQLAERTAEGWIRGRRSLAAAAAELGGDVAAAERHALYVEHRRIWHRLIASWEQDPAERDHADWDPDLLWPQEPSPQLIPDEAFAEAATAPLPAETDLPWPQAPRDDPSQGQGSRRQGQGSRRRVRAWPTSIPRRSRSGPPGRQLTLFTVAADGALSSTEPL